MSTLACVRAALSISNRNVAIAVLSPMSTGVSNEPCASRVMMRFRLHTEFRESPSLSSP
jgi:hypothetical protein